MPPLPSWSDEWVRRESWGTNRWNEGFKAGSRRVTQITDSGVGTTSVAVRVNWGIAEQLG